MNRLDSNKKPKHSEEVRMSKLDKIPNRIRMKNRLKNGGREPRLEISSKREKSMCC